MTKKIFLALLPFLVVWVSFLGTGFAFCPQNVFTHEVFWIFSSIYWFTYIVYIGTVEG